MTERHIRYLPDNATPTTDTCRHGRTFAVWCDDCEAGDWGDLHAGWDTGHAARRRSGLLAAGAFLVVALLVTIAWVSK